ncbi:MAG TPA: AAA family ATPase [Tepidisphaeraceae bacterium]|nr:AAA family ATPase [Tepidisphaeraceae bacterium]
MSGQPTPTPTPARRAPSITLAPPGPLAPPAAPAPARAFAKGTQTDELDALVRARYPIIYVVSWEEERVEQEVARVAEARNKKLFVWTCTQGIVRAGAEQTGAKSGTGPTTDPLAALDAVISQVDSSVYLFKDFHPFTEDARCNVPIIRRLRDVSFQLRDTYKTIVIVAPVMRLAPELQKDVTVIEFKPPGASELGQLLDRIVEDVKDKPQIKINLDAEGRQRLIQAAQGLTLKEAENVLAKTLVMRGKIDGDDVSIVFSEKQQIIKKSGLLEYYATQENIESIGGLAELKHWLVKRQTAFTQRAVDFGLPAPKGVLLLGVQGCGKSLCAKAVSGLWRLPLLRFDVGRMFSSLVGSSEENVRRAIQTAESVAPAVLWVDEIDKAFNDAGGGSTDSGTSSRVFGTFLTWLGEKTTPVFVIATANNISHLPPELLRKGRLDEIFFVDLPTEAERVEIFRIQIEKRGRVPDGFDLPLLARHSEGFSGAEIEQAIVSGLFDAFSKGVELDTQIVLTGLAESVPLSRTMKEDLNRLRTWCHGRARPASGLSIPVAAESHRKIEI